MSRVSTGWGQAQGGPGTSGGVKFTPPPPTGDTHPTNNTVDAVDTPFSPTNEDDALEREALRLAQRGEIRAAYVEAGNMRDRKRLIRLTARLAAIALPGGSREPIAGNLDRWKQTPNRGNYG